MTEKHRPHTNRHIRLDISWIAEDEAPNGFEDKHQNNKKNPARAGDSYGTTGTETTAQ